MRGFVIVSLVLFIALIMCGCTTAPTTVTTTTAPTTQATITYSSWLHDFTVEVPEGWERGYIADSEVFYTDNDRWKVAIRSFEIDEPLTMSELEENEQSFVNVFASGFTPPSGYIDFQIEHHFTIEYIAPDWTSYPELDIEFTFTLDGIDTWGYLFWIFTYDRQYHIVAMCHQDRLHAGDYLVEAMDFYWTFEPSYDY